MTPVPGADATKVRRREELAREYRLAHKHLTSGESQDRIAELLGAGANGIG